MVDEIVPRPGTLHGTEKGVAAAGTAGGIAALFSAAACCVLPLAFAALGVGAGGLAAFVPYHWPLTIVAAIAVAVGWALYFRRRRACMRDGSCAVAPRPRGTLVLLTVATAFVTLAAVWKILLEEPLMAWLAGA